MPPIVFFSDLHAHGWSEFAIGDDRLDDCLSVFDDVRAYCEEHGITNVCFGGDLFHKRGVVFTKPYVRVADALAAFRKAGITFSAAVGNHDMEDAEGSIDALQPLMRGKLLQGVGRKGWRHINVGWGTVTMFSYCDSRDVLAKRIEEALAVRPAMEKRIALFHHGFKGARVGSTLEYEVKEPIDAAELRLDDNFDLILSGHYHAHQKIQGVNGYYIGSPLEHTRSDRAKKKGFLVVHEDFRVEFVKLKRPRFITVNLGDKLTDKIVNGNFIDVVYESVDSLDEYLANVKALGARGVNPVPTPKAKVATKKRLNVSPELAPKKVLKRYIKHKRKDIRAQGIDRAELEKLGLALLRQTEQ